jgi:hypothetical protein
MRGEENTMSLRKRYCQVHDARGRRFAIACVCLLLGGCDRNPSDPAEVSRHQGHHAFAANLSPSEIAQSLNALRARTASWHNPENAADAGYTLSVGCTDERTEGLSANEARGMGYHTLNPGLIDGEARLLDPELIVYALEPASGKLKLAGFDYFIPSGFYPGPASADYPGQPPILEGLGTPLLWNDAHSGWIAHIWPWLHNPDGIFDNFNPNVATCGCEISPTMPLCTPEP